MTRKAVISVQGLPLPLQYTSSSPGQDDARMRHASVPNPSLGQQGIPFQVNGPSRGFNTPAQKNLGNGSSGMQRQTPVYSIYSDANAAIEKVSDGGVEHPYPLPWPSGVFKDLIDYSKVGRTDVNARLVASIFQHHGPNCRVATVPVGYELDLFGFFSDPAHGKLVPFTDPRDGTGLSYIGYVAPSRRSSQIPGVVVEAPLFAGFHLQYGDRNGAKFEAYYVQWQEGFNANQMVYLVHERGERGDREVEALVLDIGTWTRELRNEVYVFDQGYWQKSRELWESIQKANWDDIILEDNLKEDIISDVSRFFRGRQTYEGLGVSWKRGILLIGPPGNGKTITLKALSKTLGQGDKDCKPSEKSKSCMSSIPTLYVKSFASFGGPEYSMKQVFDMARQEAPCVLALEDLDAFITDETRSFFFNEVDGLIENNGIFLIASTNHPERLNPGITKRPSRFDRKYMFPNPGFEGRKQYCLYWQRKLKDTPINFTDKLVAELAEMMDKFSFAYMKEAFVSTLLVLAARRGDEEGDNAFAISFDKELTITCRSDAKGDEWAKGFEKVIKKQIETLKEQIGDDDDD